MQMLLLLQLGYTSWVFACKPLEIRGMNLVIMANEFTLLTVMYIMLIFASEKNQELVYAFGTVFFVITFLVIGWNMVYIFFDSIKSFLKYTYLKNRQL